MLWWLIAIILCALLFIAYKIVQSIINTSLLNPMWMRGTHYTLLFDQHGIETISIPVSNEKDVTLRCYHKKNNDTKKYLLFFGGNGMYMIQQHQLICDLAKYYSVFTFDYRGYGESTGEPDYNNIVTDAILVFEYMINKMNINPNDIVVSGLSLGGAVACQVVNNVIQYSTVARLILINTFTSLNDMAEIMIRKKYGNSVLYYTKPFIKLMLHRVLNTEYCLNSINKHGVKVVIIHNKYDELIPIIQSLKNYNAVKSNPQNKYYMSDTGSHSEITNFDLLAI